MKTSLSFATNNLNPGKWYPVSGVLNGSISANNANDFLTLFLCTQFGKVKNLRVKIDQTGGSTNGEIFTVYKNGSATGLTVTLNGTAAGSNTTASFDVAPGDVINAYYDSTSDGNPSKGIIALEIG